MAGAEGEGELLGRVRSLRIRCERREDELLAKGLVIRPVHTRMCPVLIPVRLGYIPRFRADCASAVVRGLSSVCARFETERTRLPLPAARVPLDRRPRRPPRPLPTRRRRRLPPAPADHAHRFASMACPLAGVPCRIFCQRPRARRAWYSLFSCVRRKTSQALVRLALGESKRGS